MTSSVFLHWLSCVLSATSIFILSRIILLIFPISDLYGLMSWHCGLFWKLGLWSFNVMYDSLLAAVSILSLSCSESAMFLSFRVLVVSSDVFVFLYSLLTFFLICSSYF